MENFNNDKEQNKIMGVLTLLQKKEDFCLRKILDIHKKCLNR